MLRTRKPNISAVTAAAKADRHFVTALGRGLEVLACFRHGDRMLGNQDIARACGLPKSTVSRLTNTLTKLGYLVYVEDSAKYSLGTATLSFDTCSSGQLSYTFTDGTGRAGTIPLKRLTQNVTCSATTARPTNANFLLSGNWFEAATSGQGLTVEVNPISGVIFFAWMTYAPNGAGAGPAGQRWYTGQCTFSYMPVQLYSSVPVQLYETTGGLFDNAMASPTTVVVGSGTFYFENCSAHLDFNFTGGSSVGASGQISLNRTSADLLYGAGFWDY